MRRFVFHLVEEADVKLYHGWSRYRSYCDTKISHRFERCFIGDVDQVGYSTPKPTRIGSGDSPLLLNSSRVFSKNADQFRRN